MEKVYTTLRQMVETHVGRQMKTPRDFSFLTLRIWETLHVQISPTTMKRFWGYLPSELTQNPRMYTLDILAKFVGYRGWNDFQKYIVQDEGMVDSCFVEDKVLYTRTLKEGTHLRLAWMPNRRVIVELKGQDLFAVVESENSKLSVGDTFICPSFVQGEPLFLHCLVHEGGRPVDYVCGKGGGVRYEILCPV